MIKRRVREYGISVRLQEGILSDNELDALVRDMQREFPNAGYRRIYKVYSVFISTILQSTSQDPTKNVAGGMFCVYYMESIL